MKPEAVHDAADGLAKRHDGDERAAYAQIRLKLRLVVQSIGNEWGKQVYGAGSKKPYAE